MPALSYGPSCTSTLALRNLGERVVTVEVEGHRDSGALVGLVGLAGTTVRLGPGGEGSYRLRIDEETTGAWAKIRERVPSPDLTPAIAVSGSTECVSEKELRTTARGVSYPTRSPWFAGEVASMPGSRISLINTSEEVARASVCYSSGGWYSVPAGSRGGAVLLPVCSESLDVQIPPFASREFDVAHNGSSYLTLKTVGRAIVLEMMHPIPGFSRLYTVDSTIRFGGEVPQRE